MEAPEMMAATDPRELRRRGASALAVALLALGACGGDTGLLIEVTRADAAPAQIPRLRVYTAVASDAGPTFYVDSADAQAEVDLTGRDLQASPYRLLLSAGSALPADAALQVAAVGYRVDGTTPVPIAFGAIDHPVRFAAGEILSFRLTLDAPGDVVVDPRGCADFTLDGQPVHIGAADDWDCDGDPHGTDCDDASPEINHAATEVCGNSVDEDCSGMFDDDTDADGDGVSACNGDCIDNPAAPLPQGLTAVMFNKDAPEIAGNRFDENCDHKCDVEDRDQDRDDYTTDGIHTVGAVAGMCRKNDNLIDCNDDDQDIHPEATEDPQNGDDDDCDGTCDVDADGDGFTTSGYVNPPTAGHCAQATDRTPDCDDVTADDPPGGPGAAMIYPGAPEHCDGVDEDCDGLCDPDPDDDGYSTCGTVVVGGACTLISGTCMPGLACDCAPDSGAAHPPGANAPDAERCDGFDQNCDGQLYPSDQRCFGPGMVASACLAGTRTCDDTSPTQPWGACQVDPLMPADPKLCEAYATCFADAAVVDPYQCALDQAGLASRACRATTVGAALCTPDYLALEPVAPTGCDTEQWAVVGGTHQGAWTVGLAASPTGSIAAAFTGCGPYLVVTAFDPNALGAALPQKVVVTQKLNGTTQSGVITLRPQTGSACTTENNLVCQ